MVWMAPEVVETQATGSHQHRDDILVEITDGAFHWFLAVVGHDVGQFFLDAIAIDRHETR
jgi:hypothetical protein